MSSAPLIQPGQSADNNDHQRLHCAQSDGQNPFTLKDLSYRTFCERGAQEALRQAAA
ncbi:hypothetical protein [Deinococcus oregonensis]|uniref:hypothetical protein n=1 Tax=Deinococcus oregonensis TaxID=1805970 RepID=UPI0036D3387A